MVAAAGLLGSLLIWPTIGPVAAHGSTQSPASRVYACRFDQPNNQMCAEAWAHNAQALYDWMEVNIGDADGRHRDLIPDGQLCSAGRQKYAAFDRPGAWPVTPLATDQSGIVDLVYENTAPHATAYYRVYITRVGFDARTETVGWGDLELVHDSGPLDRSARQTLWTPLPDRLAPALLYVVWQRSDSPEAFYACSDVTVNAGGANLPPSSTPSTTAAPVTVAPQTSTTSVEEIIATSLPTTQATTEEQSSTSQPAANVTVTAAENPAAPATSQRPPDTATSQPGAVSSIAPPQTSPPQASAPPTAPPQTSSTAIPRSAADTSAINSTGPAEPSSTRPLLSVDVSAEGTTSTTEQTVAMVAVKDVGPLDRVALRSPADLPETGSPQGESPLGLIMIGLGSIGLVAMGAGLRWPHRVFP